MAEPARTNRTQSRPFIGGETLARELRKTGISVVGDVPWGTHFCTFYETKQDLLDILVPFFKTGLENKEFCLWIISDSVLMTIEAAATALRKAVPDLDRYVSEGSLEFVERDNWFLDGDGFDFEKVADRFKEKVDGALARGYAGVRVNGSPAWLHPKDEKRLVAFEQAVDKLYPNLRIIASCTYPITESDAAELLDVADAHQFVLVRRRGSWEVFETPELLQARSELKKLNEELEQRVVERTRELAAANEALRKEIAERKRAELESRTLIDAIPQQIWSGPPDGTNDYVNERWRSETGIALEDVRGDGWQTLVHPADRDRVLRAWQYSVLNGTPYEQEERHLIADGSYRWYLNRAVPLRDREGRIIRWYGSNTDLEDRKQAEEALRRSENELRLVVDTIPVMAWTLQPDGVVDFFNRRSLEYAGLSFAEYVADPTRPIHPDDVSQVMEKWRAQMARGETYEDEVRLRSSAGEYRWFLVRTAPLRDASGKIVKWYGVSTDIEDRKRAREALQESEAKLKETQRLARVGYWERDLLADRTTLSEETAVIFGFSKRLFTHAEMQAMVHPDDREAQEIALQDALQGKRHYDHEFRIVLSNGQVRFIHAWDEIAYDESGHPVRMFGTVQDITERKRAEEELRESQQLLRLVLATLPVGVAVTNQSGDIVLVNSASKRIWGGDTIVSGRQRWAQSKGVWHDSGESVGPTEWASVRAISKGQTSLNELIDIETYDGRQKTMENSAAPIRNSDGQIVGSVIVNEDVTERVRAEEQLKRYNRELRALSARLHSVREEESARIAREIHDELGGSLTSLRWDLEEVGEVVAEAAAVEQVAGLGEKIAAMMSLTEVTLDTVRRLSSELRPMALDELGLVAAIEWQARQFEHRTGIAVQYESSAEKIDLNNTQSTAIFRIFQEAMTNILRHAQATKVTIQLKQDGAGFSLTIEDNGKGFKEKEKSDAQSLGIVGMRERALLMGGEIKIESAEERGTKITLLIPISS